MKFMFELGIVAASKRDYRRIAVRQLGWSFQFLSLSGAGGQLWLQLAVLTFFCQITGQVLMSATG